LDSRAIGVTVGAGVVAASLVGAAYYLFSQKSPRSPPTQSRTSNIESTQTNQQKEKTSNLDDPSRVEISAPFNLSKDFSIKFDPETNSLQGVPPIVYEEITKAGYTVEQVIADPLLIKDLLYNMDYEKLKEAASPFSKPIQVHHDFSISFDPSTGKWTGVPPMVEEAILKAGFTIDEVTKNPELVKDLLYQLDYNTVKESVQPQVSKPTNVQHDFSIRYNHATGKFEGVPEEIKKVLISKGYTEEQVFKDPNSIKDILYNFDYEQVKQSHLKKDNSD